MKKLLIISHCIMLLCCGVNLAAAEPSSKVNIHHIITTKNSVGSVDYDFIDPTGTSHRGSLSNQSIFHSPTKIFKFDTPELYGPYTLHYDSCNWTSCVSFDQIVVVNKNEQVLWSISEEGVLEVTETDL